MLKYIVDMVFLKSFQNARMMSLKCQNKFILKYLKCSVDPEWKSMVYFCYKAALSRGLKVYTMLSLKYSFVHKCTNVTLFLLYINVQKCIQFYLNFIHLLICPKNIFLFQYLSTVFHHILLQANIFLTQ